MLSLEAASVLSPRHGFMPEDGVMVEDVVFKVGEKFGFEQIASASRMNKAVVVFLNHQSLDNQLVASGIVMNDMLVSHCIAPSVRGSIFYAEWSSRAKLNCFNMISLGRKHPELKHVVSFNRRVSMILNLSENMLKISFPVRHVHIVERRRGRLTAALNRVLM
ncbi:uncharacterized protein LOC108179569 [Tachysurus ichikawai]